MELRNRKKGGESLGYCDGVVHESRINTPQPSSGMPVLTHE